MAFHPEFSSSRSDVRCKRARRNADRDLAAQLGVLSQIEPVAAPESPGVVPVRPAREERRRRRAYTPDEIRERLHTRLAGTPPDHRPNAGRRRPAVKPAR